MQRKYLCLLATSMLTLVGSATSLNAQIDTPRDALRAAERMVQVKGSLAKAITAAEKHSSGTAVGVRVSMSNELFGQADRAARSSEQRQPRQPAPGSGSNPQGLNVQERNAAGEQAMKEQANRGGQSQAAPADLPLYAIVACVVDSARVREVVVDMRDNSVVGMHAATLGQATSRARNGSDSKGDSWNRDAAGDPRSKRLVRASELMNASALNSHGDRVGDIDELAIDPDSNRVVYGVLRRGGFLGFGESRYAIDTNELAAPRNGQIVLNYEDSDFESRSGFDNNNWPTQADPEWVTRRPSDQDAPQPQAKRVVKASKIIGTEVVCSDGISMGKINDLIVEPSTGRVHYAIIDSTNGQLPVPMASLTAQGDRFVLPMKHADIQTMPTFDSDREPNWEDFRWNRRLHENFGTSMDESALSTRAPGDNR